MRLLEFENAEGEMVVVRFGLADLKLGDRLLVYGKQSELDEFSS
jgi:hypothetical protein